MRQECGAALLPAWRMHGRITARAGRFLQNKAAQRKTGTLSLDGAFSSEHSPLPSMQWFCLSPPWQEGGMFQKSCTHKPGSAALHHMASNPAQRRPPRLGNASVEPLWSLCGVLHHKLRSMARPLLFSGLPCAHEAQSSCPAAYAASDR